MPACAEHVQGGSLVASLWIKPSTHNITCSRDEAMFQQKSAAPIVKHSVLDQLQVFVLWVRCEVSRLRHEIL